MLGLVAPVLQLMDAKLPAMLNRALLPEQMKEGPAMLTDGSASVWTGKRSVPVHPAELLTVTV
jgi:hypothetical protein